ncbi:MAG: hypothetical protein GY906_13020 [bacterium]|nr:hypothetical protein [bacterium]
MTAYLGRLLIDLEDDDLVPAHYVIADDVIVETDAEDFVDSYEPAEGCP